MERGDLPWEASEAILELLTYLNGSQQLPGGESVRGKRPLIMVARWFWRTTQARPTLPVEQRWRATAWLYTAERSGSQRLRRQVEFQLASWWSADEGQRLDAALRSIAESDDSADDARTEIDFLRAKTKSPWFGVDGNLSELYAELDDALEAMGDNIDRFEAVFGVSLLPYKMSEIMHERLRQASKLDGKEAGDGEASE
ncbi:MAG: hypothetical protein WEB52_07110 [Dehalococcoidia bacterium]